MPMPSPEIQAFATGFPLFLAHVGVTAGRGPIAFGYVRFTDEMRKEIGLRTPGPVQKDLAAGLTLDTAGADVKGETVKS